uniref:Uncharacterized protein n=1 Tax=Romanomermis culicivorax TaxID=13658 RepID=A0A915I560_ROMCU
MRRYRRQNRPIFYQDETWLNAGHIPVKAWVDTMIEENPYDALSSNNNLTLGYNDPIVDNIFCRQHSIK